MGVIYVESIEVCLITLNVTRGSAVRHVERCSIEHIRYQLKINQYSLNSNPTGELHTGEGFSTGTILKNADIFQFMTKGIKPLCASYMLLTNKSLVLFRLILIH